MRRTTRAAAAHQPIALKFGTSPMSVDAIPMDSRETTRRAFLPTLSPRWPAMMPPSGRAKKPTARLAKAARLLPSSLWLGKNWTLKIRAAAVP